jgi:small subunit ribosomal protein S20
LTFLPQFILSLRNYSFFTVHYSLEDMPIIKSAIKRVRQSEKRRQRNLTAQRNYKVLVKEFDALIAGGKTAEAQKLFPQVQKALDLAAKKNIMHKNTAARKKSRLAKMMSTKGTAKKAAPVKKEEK